MTGKDRITGGRRKGVSSRSQRALNWRGASFDRVYQAQTARHPLPLPPQPRSLIEAIDSTLPQERELLGALSCGEGTITLRLLWIAASWHQRKADRHLDGVDQRPENCDDGR